MIAATYSARDATMFGGLTSYGPSQAEVHRQAGVHTGRVLNGAIRQSYLLCSQPSSPL